MLETLLGQRDAREAIEELSVLLGANVAAILHVLQTKGLITDEEWEAVLAKATEMMRAGIEKRKQAARDEYRKQHPEAAAFLDRMTKPKGAAQADNT